MANDANHDTLPPLIVSSEMFSNKISHPCHSPLARRTPVTAAVDNARIEGKLMDLIATNKQSISPKK